MLNFKSYLLNTLSNFSFVLKVIKRFCYNWIFHHPPIFNFQKILKLVVNLVVDEFYWYVKKMELKIRSKPDSHQIATDQLSTFMGKWICWELEGVMDFKIHLLLPKKIFQVSRHIFKIPLWIKFWMSSLLYIMNNFVHINNRKHLQNFLLSRTF